MYIYIVNHTYYSNVHVSYMIMHGHAAVKKTTHDIFNLETISNLKYPTTISIMIVLFSMSNVCPV